MTLLSAALAYAREGRPVFPLSPKSKRPIHDGGFKNATIDEAQIRAWWSETPDANIGQACGLHAALDVDVKDDKRGDIALMRLIRDRGPIPWTRQSTTPSGGYQHHYTVPAGIHVARTIGRLAPGIDVLGVGGYTVLPPSVTDVGRYAWVEDGAPLAELGGWLLEAVKASPPKPAPAPTTRPRWTDDVEQRAKRAIAYVSRRDPAISGARGHDAAYSVALDLVRGFSLPHDVASIILADYNTRCVPPWSQRELDHKLRSAAAARRVGDGYLLQEERRHG